jgi:hypothetical protein
MAIELESFTVNLQVAVHPEACREPLVLQFAKRHIDSPRLADAQAITRANPSAMRRQTSARLSFRAAN